MSDPYYGSTMSDYCLLEDEFHRQAGERWGWEPSIEGIRDALKAPVPHAAEVSAVVARCGIWGWLRTPGGGHGGMTRREGWAAGFDSVVPSACTSTSTGSPPSTDKQQRG